MIYLNNIDIFLINYVNCQQADGEDELKKRQLMELAIINGTYRDSNTKVAAATGIYLKIYFFLPYKNKI